MDFLRDIKRQLVESHREVRERLEDGMRDFLARAAVDATLGQIIQRNTEGSADSRRTLTMRSNGMDDNRPRSLLTQLSETLRTVKKIVEAVAARGR